jgi:hypothetical protein
MKMQRVGATIILGLLAVGGLSGCSTIGWMGTKVLGCTPQSRLVF